MIIAHGKLVASDSPEGLRRLMEGSGELELGVKGVYEELEPVLREIPGVERVEAMNIAEKDCTGIRIYTKEKADVREAVFYAMAECKAPIMQMLHKEKSLEDIFLELTEDVEPSVKSRKHLFSINKNEKAKKKAVPEADGGQDEAADSPVEAPAAEEREEQ